MSNIVKVPMRIVQSMPQFQSRADASLDYKAVDEYAERYRQGLPMDPIQVCGQRHLSYYVVDGHHRFEGMKRAGFTPQTEIEVEVLDARINAEVIRWNAAGANTKHGKKRTQADKRKAVTMALQDFPETPDVQIAQHCDVSRMYVYNMRDELGIPHPQNEQITAKQAEIPLPPPPPAPPAGRPSEGEEGRSDVVNVYNGVSSESTSAPSIPPPPPSPPETPKDEPQERPQAVPPPPPPPSPVPCHWPDKPVDATADPIGIKDLGFRPIPPDMRELYNRKEEVMSVSSKLRDCIAMVRKGIEAHDPLWGDADNTTLSHLESALKAVEDCKPLYVCPACSGMSQGCQLCSHRGGFIGRKQYEIVKQDPVLMKFVHRAERKHVPPPPPTPEREGSDA